MTVFRPSAAYQPLLDVRFDGSAAPQWAQHIVNGEPPNGECWLVVMSRRAGKTWTAAAVERARPAGTTLRVDLRGRKSTIVDAGLACLVGEAGAPNVRDKVVVIDEPGLAAVGSDGVTAETLAAGLAAIRSARGTSVVFLTPHEHSLLSCHLSVDSVRDEILPPALTSEEAARLANRAIDWAPDLLAQIVAADAGWLQSPFLLELAFQMAEVMPELRTDLNALFRAARDESAIRHNYLTQVYNNGLSSDHRATLRTGRWSEAGVAIEALPASNLLTRLRLVTDPIVASHLPTVLRIHHITDLHRGGSLRSNVDSKDSSEAALRVASAAGAGSPLDAYLNHIRQLALREKAPHIIVVTGDIVNRTTDGEGPASVEWLDAIRGNLAHHPDLSDDDPRILLVGGNHDVAWHHCLDREPEARHRWFAETFAEFPHPDLHIANRRERRLYVNLPGCGVRIALLGSAESGGEARDDEQRAVIRARVDELDGVADEENLRLLLADLEHLDPGVIAREILDRLVADPGYLTLAAVHHPLSPVPTVEVTPYSGIVNAGQVKQALCRSRVALVLHGHTHIAFLAAERQLLTTPLWTLRIAGAASLASRSSDEQNGYTEVLIAREGRDHTIVLQPTRYQGGEWMPLATVSFRPGEARECSLHEMVSDRTM